MKKLMVSIVLFLSLVLMDGCASATPILVLAPPTATNSQVITNTPTRPVPTLPPTATLTIPPAATLILTPTEVPIPNQKAEWTFAAGEPIWGPITVSGGVVYFGSDDSYLYAVDTTSHALKWKFKTGGAVRSRPAVSKNLVFATSQDSNLYVISIDNGTLAWRTPIGDPIDLSQDPFTSSPTIQDNAVYVGGTDDNLYAIDASTGRVNWKLQAAMIAGIRQTPVVGNGMVYFGNVVNFYAIDAKDGTQVWVFSVPNDLYQMDGNGATLVDQMVYVVREELIMALDAKTGEEKWQVPNPPNATTDAAFKIPAYEDGVLYVDGFKDGSYYPIGAYDATTGKLLWVANPPSYGTSASPAIGKNNLYLGRQTGFFAIDKKTVQFNG